MALLPRTSLSRHARSRLAFLILTIPAVAMGVVAGCGVDDFGTLVYATDDASESVGASLPEAGGGADATVDAAVDAPGDTQIPVGPQCASSDCVAKGGSCAADNTCEFTCNTGGSCATGVTCPAGVPCRVSCSATDSCPAPIDCLAASACDITCAKHACWGIACAGKTCVVNCAGSDSCDDGGITCTATDSCDIRCNGGGSKSCDEPVTCTSAACSVACGKDACKGGVTANAADASIYCGQDGCGPAATCNAQFCQLGCKSGSCTDVLCCDAGTCVLDGGDGTSCP